MKCIIDFKFDGLTEDEQYQLEKRLNLIKDHIYPSLDVRSTCLHRENNVSINQFVSMDKALELFKLLSSMCVDKKYDDWYETGVDSRLSCSLTIVKEFPCNDEKSYS
jgi:hypothetical protein